MHCDNFFCWCGNGGGQMAKGLRGQQGDLESNALKSLDETI
jgi:hypothetical protein